MTPSLISQRTVSSRLQLVDNYIAELRSLPLDNWAAFLADSRNIAAAESYLRRALESLFDIGRHMLAKGFASGVTEYKEIARQLGQFNILDAQESQLLFVLAGYRNRMVHFYHEITPDELYHICTTQLGDVDRIAQAYRHWINAHPEKIDTTL